MFRRILFAGAVLLSASVSQAQLGQQQRQDDLGIMSSPQGGQLSVPSSMNAPIQQVSPLQTAPVQSPTITNNPDYPRQPIFVPTPYVTPYPQFMGQFPGQLPQMLPGQLPGQIPGQPLQPGQQQRGMQA